MIRLDAVQRWPVEKNEPCTAQLTAVARSASPRITSGFLPPISICTLAMRPMAACATLAPVLTEPVKLMAFTRRSFRKAWPTTLPRPMTRLNTPLGRPARLMISASAQALAGTSSAGLISTQLP